MVLWSNSSRVNLVRVILSREVSLLLFDLLQRLGSRVWGLELRVWGLGFRVWGLGFGVEG